MSSSPFYETSFKRAKLKLKYLEKVPKEITSVKNMSLFPSKKIALISNNNDIFILDEKFKIIA